MTATSKVRIYDLAKDLKIDTKRLIEEVRREGVDVSVPSNSVSKEVADKIRDKYFPKKDTAVKRGVKVVKKAARPVVEEVPTEVLEEPVAAAAPIVAEEPAPVSEPEPAKSAISRVVRKLAPAARAEKPAATVTVTPVPGESQPTISPEAVSAAESHAPEQTEAAKAPSRQVRVLRPTAAAINAGIRPGERAPAPPPVMPPRDRSRERAARARVEYTGTPGETLTPQTTYIPPPDAGRRRSRRGSSRTGKRVGEGKGGKFDREFIPPPPTLTLEERIAGRLEAPTVPGELKPVRLVEGSTVKEFAEKLGIKPKDIVTLLLQRGVFATINQALNDDVAHELPAERVGAERIAVRSREWPEHFCPFRVGVQAIGIVDGVPGLVPKEHHDHGVIFDLAGLLLFDA